MIDFILPWYSWIKALHIIAMVTWMASLFYLPRLFVYHATTTNNDTSETFKTMERRLYKGIANPSIAVVFILGILMLVLNPSLLKFGWMHAKITLALTLLVYHIMCGKYLRAFAKDANTKSHTFYRWFNEYPILVLIAITLLIVIRPW